MRHWQYELDLDQITPLAAPDRGHPRRRVDRDPGGIRSKPAPDVPAATPRQHRGRSAYLSGLAAEEAVERHLVAQGMTCLKRRWRGPGGEIDRIFSSDDKIVFVEVKKAVSHDCAAERIFRRQADRIALSAMAFLEGEASGSLTDMRIDVALVDAMGAVKVIENAFAGWW
tara:strand:- start:6473 stop:6982 length:510 start_codon:yes stop_codon:yes gene_type:complete